MPALLMVQCLVGPRGCRLNFRLLQIRLLAHIRSRVRNGEISERRLARITGVSQPHLHPACTSEGVRSSCLRIRWIIRQDPADHLRIDCGSADAAEPWWACTKRPHADDAIADGGAASRRPHRPWMSVSGSCRTVTISVSGGGRQDRAFAGSRESPAPDLRRQSPHRQRDAAVKSSMVRVQVVLRLDPNEEAYFASRPEQRKAAIYWICAARHLPVRRWLHRFGCAITNRGVGYR